MLACGTVLWTCRCLLCMHMLIILSIENMFVCFQCYSDIFHLKKHRASACKGVCCTVRDVVMANPQRSHATDTLLLFCCSILDRCHFPPWHHKGFLGGTYFYWRYAGIKKVKIISHFHFSCTQGCGGFWGVHWLARDTGYCETRLIMWLLHNMTLWDIKKNKMKATAAYKAFRMQLVIVVRWHWHYADFSSECQVAFYFLLVNVRLVGVFVFTGYPCVIFLISTRSHQLALHLLPSLPQLDHSCWLIRSLYKAPAYPCVHRCYYCWSSSLLIFLDSGCRLLEDGGQQCRCASIKASKAANLPRGRCESMKP